MARRGQAATREGRRPCRAGARCGSTPGEQTGQNKGLGRHRLHCIATLPTHPRVRCRLLGQPLVQLRDKAIKRGRARRHLRGQVVRPALQVLLLLRERRLHGAQRQADAGSVGQLRGQLLAQQLLDKGGAGGGGGVGGQDSVCRPCRWAGA